MLPRLLLPLVPVCCAGRLTLLATLCAMATPTAHAQWSVVDREANEKLDTANDKLDAANDKLDTANDELNSANKVLGVTQDASGATINKNIYNLNQRLNLGDAKAPGTRVEDPRQAWTDLQLTQDTAQCERMAASQKDICTELARTRNAHYMYMKTMYDNTKTRYDRLDGLVRERTEQQIGVNDYGKLEDNTNQILALQTLVALDRQQAETVNHAYQARIAYLNAQLTGRANAATSGQTSVGGALGPVIGSFTSTVASGVMLKTALDSARHGSMPAARTLSIDR